LMVVIYILMLFGLAAIPDSIVISSDVLLVVPELILMIPGLIFIMVFKAESAEDVRFGGLSIKQILLIIMITYTVMPITSVLNMLTSMGVESAGDVIADTASLMPAWKMILYVAVVPAVCEEFLFRGLIYHGYRRRNRFVAILLSSVLFGLIHMNVNQFSYAFTIGIVMSLLVEITGSMWSSMLMHFLFNGTNVGLVYFLNYVNKFVNTDYVAGESATQSADSAAVTWATGIYSVVLYAGLVVVAVCMFILAMRELIKISGKRDDFKSLFSKEERITFKNEGRFADGYLFAGIIPAVGFILFQEVLMRML